MPNFAAIKANARRAVHAAFAYSATYQDSSLDAAVDITVRWHNRLVLLGDFQDSGYSNVVDGIERIIFNLEELATVKIMVDGIESEGLTPRKNAVIKITDVGFEGTELILEAREPKVGPIEEKWQVIRGDV